MTGAAAVALGARAAAPWPPAYLRECGSCHVAYAPTLLPAASWQRLLGDLPQHFGSDASLDAATVRQLRTWLDGQAGRGPAPPDDRITRSGWFVREHDEVPPAAWNRPAVQSRSNCVACHPGAQRGAFDEHAVRIPR